MGMLSGKRFLITGVLSTKSIAYAVAQFMHEQGASLAFTYQEEKFKARVTDLVAPFSDIVLQCDVTEDQDIERLFIDLKESWDEFDGFVHAIAFAPAGQLEGDFHEVVTREGFRTAHEVSSYSLCAMAQVAAPLLKENASIITLSYLGAEKAVPSYNVMGLAKASLEANVRYLAKSLGPKSIRVNAVSAGPVKTLAASGIKHFKKMLSHTAEVAPLKRNIDAKEVGQVVGFLGSDLSSGITGEVIHVDAGYSIVGMTGLEQ